MTDARFLKCSQCGARNRPRTIFCKRCGASLPKPSQDSPRPRLNSTTLAFASALVLSLSILVFVLYTVIAHSLDDTIDIMLYADQEGIPASTEPPVSNADTESSDAEEEPLPTTTTEPPVMVRPKAATASSALDGTSTASFRPTNLLDNDLASAWIEGAEGTGLGEWVRFEFTKPMVLSRIEIANGYQKDMTRFTRSPRVRLVHVEYSSGSSQLVELLDTEQIQFIVPPEVAVDSVKLVIVSVYDGAENEDTALSEVHFYERPE